MSLPFREVRCCVFWQRGGVWEFLRERAPAAPVPGSPAHCLLGPKVLRQQVSSALSRS